MTLIRLNPFREMEDLFDRFSRSLARSTPERGDGGQEQMTLADWAPRVDISESDSEYQLKVELPEVRKEDVNVTVHQGVLTIEGDRSFEREESNRRYHRVERAYGRFARSFTLPESVDEKGIRAEHKDGMLYVHVAKSEDVKPKSIEIKAA